MKTESEKQSNPPTDSQEIEPSGSDSCHCLETIRTNLLKVYDDVDLMLSQYMDTGEDGKMTFGLGLPPLRFTFRQGKKKGKSHITFNFCPFCGRKEP